MSKKKIALAIVGFVFLVYVLGYIDVLAGNWLTETARMLLVGWIGFLISTLPKTSADWPSVVVGAMAVVLFLIGVHLLARRFGPWKFRWSLALFGGIVLLFVAGISLVGFTHQIAWLCSSNQPILVPGPASRFGWKTRWINDQKQIALATHMVLDVYKRFPRDDPFTPDGRMLHSWETHLLPYIPYDASKIDMTIPWNNANNAENFKGVIPLFTNPGLSWKKLFDDDGFGVSHVAANSWIISAHQSLRMEDITDGTSTTILYGGINDNFPAWGNPINWRDPSIGINTSPHGFGGPPGCAGTYFVMVDASVRFVSDKVSPQVLRALSTPRGGESIDESELDR